MASCSSRRGQNESACTAARRRSENPAPRGGGCGGRRPPPARGAIGPGAQRKAPRRRHRRRRARLAPPRAIAGGGRHRGAVRCQCAEGPRLPREEGGLVAGVRRLPADPRPRRHRCGDRGNGRVSARASLHPCLSGGEGCLRREAADALRGGGAGAGQGGPAARACRPGGDAAALDGDQSAGVRVCPQRGARKAPRSSRGELRQRLPDPGAAPGGGADPNRLRLECLAQSGRRPPL